MRLRKLDSKKKGKAEAEKEEICYHTSYFFFMFCFFCFCLLLYYDTSFSSTKYLITQVQNIFNFNMSFPLS